MAKATNVVVTDREREPKVQRAIDNARRVIQSKGPVITGRGLKNVHILAAYDIINDYRNANNGEFPNADWIAENMPRLAANVWERNSRKELQINGKAVKITPDHELYHRKGEALPDGQFGAIRFFAKLANRAKSSDKGRELAANYLAAIAEASGVELDSTTLDVSDDDLDAELEAFEADEVSAE